MPVEIKHKHTGDVLHRIEADTLIGADLDSANLNGADLAGADLSGADLTDADLRNADLRGAAFCDTELGGAEFCDADVSGVDLNGSKFEDVPIIEHIHQSVFAAAFPPGRFDMKDWRACAMTRCRAGLVIMLAGKPGKALAQQVGTGTAAALIYIASDPSLQSVPDWYELDEEALTDMNWRAERERAMSRKTVLRNCLAILKRLRPA